MSGISLNASMRSNLLSLQQTQKLQDTTQLRLSTGLKVNSAIDNPSSYYTASSLNNRANDLGALLDAMSQGIQTIKAASETLTTAIKFLEQAKAVATQTSESGMDIIAKVKTEDELLAAVNSGKTGYIVIAADINLTNQIQLKDNQNLVGDNYFKEYNGANRKLSFDFTGKSGDAILAGNNSKISNLDLEYVGDSEVERSGVVAAKNVKNVIISNLNIKADNPDLNDTHGNLLAGILIDNGASAKINGDINIHAKGKRNWGIGVVQESYSEIKANINIQTDDAWSAGIQCSMGTGPNAKIDIRAGSVLNIKTLGSNSNSIAASTYSNINITDTTLNLVSAATYAIGSASNGTLILNNSHVNIKDSLNGITNGANLNISNSILNIKSSNYGFSSTNATTNISKNTIMNIELTSNLASSTGISLASNNNLGCYLNIDGTSRINIKTMTSNQTAIRTGTNTTSGVETVLDTKNGTIININRGGALDGLFTFTKDYNNRNTSGTTNINDFSATDADKSAKEEIIINDPIVPDINDALKQNFNGDYKSKEANEGKQYNSILEQYNQLINDAGYKGINLLLNQDLLITFNEERSSKIDVKGVDASSKGLGLSETKWQSQTDVQKSLDEINSAINQIRSQSSEFGNYYSIVSSRQDFTENLINVLTEGADKLTLADMNEESANMLALQTRQQLAINSLSLASQANQSILKLF